MATIIIIIPDLHCLRPHHLYYRQFLVWLDPHAWRKKVCVSYLSANTGNTSYSNSECGKLKPPCKLYKARLWQQQLLLQNLRCLRAHHYCGFLVWWDLHGERVVAISKNIAANFDSECDKLKATIIPSMGEVKSPPGSLLPFRKVTSPRNT